MSAVTFTNWVDKTANLLEELGVEPGDTAWLPVVSARPGHWVGAVWTIAAWLSGVTVSLTDRSSAAIAVGGPDGVPADFDGPSVACSLHPLGMGFAGTVPAEFDYADVLAQPDMYLTVGRDPRDDLVRPAWDSAAAPLGELATLPARDDRFVLVPVDPRRAIVDGVWRCLLGTGGVVIVTGGNAGEVEAIAAAERADGPTSDL